ncbi:hypothetical protein PILCRDRAFT_436285 [Piloderma croceum F 1598]|uniref:Uncharacterized protein n=1 Tax=Piloderma croceum (strain F 1598) TaxID=765440 RepID=A0A0C3FYD2_PILCF|nr:hypothetical protein PILCRDRAFT_436285 [Piloderma croceum F 1598]
MTLVKDAFGDRIMNFINGSWLAAAFFTTPSTAIVLLKVHTSHILSFCGPWNKGGQEEGFRMRLLWCFSAGAETVFMRSLQISTVLHKNLPEKCLEGSQGRLVTINIAY